VHYKKFQDYLKKLVPVFKKNKNSCFNLLKSSDSLGGASAFLKIRFNSCSIDKTFSVSSISASCKFSPSLGKSLFIVAVQMVQANHKPVLEEKNLEPLEQVHQVWMKAFNNSFFQIF
jgi:hypothetical protein